MMSSENISMVRELERRLVTYESQVDTAYLIRMWRFALSHVDDDSALLSSSSRCDAIPYYPLPMKDGPIVFTTETRLLDVGCLGGYGLFDLAMRLRQQSLDVPQMTGIDIFDMSISMGRDLATIWAPSHPPSFIKSSIEDVLPNGCGYNLIICRLVLPYTDVHRALKCMASQLDNAGLIILQVHAPRYYLQQASLNLNRPRQLAYYLKPCLNGLAFALSGHQIRHQFFKETALTGNLLDRLCRSEGLIRYARLGYDAKPIYVYRKVS